MLYEMAMNGDVEPVTKYETGVKLRFLAGDILWLFSTKNKLKALPEFLKFRDDNWDYAICSRDDPKPTIGFLLDTFLSMMWRARRKYILES